MKILIRILFFVGLFLFLFSYFIDPYTVHDGDDIVIDADVVGFLKLLYAITSLIFGWLSYLFLRTFKNRVYLIFSLVLLMINLIFLSKMFLYFDNFLE
ncbi:hypothetical protein [Flavobacterium humidisoli]|uniref:Uncharacterized protein n=1 Tax=Flavobacterium humidisoli TaxID=2937442 RepID=A0ABY4LXG5_9FLAO|nr:hypothetical protein [Flavobacterium humidisoli]UPZ17768.1 hypothetical protein M0M44_10560 [Flavobacterium humidisoli]